MVYFSDNSLILCYSSCFVLYSHYGDSISSKKLNGHRHLIYAPLGNTHFSHFSFETTDFILVMITHK